MTLNADALTLNTRIVRIIRIGLGKWTHDPTLRQTMTKNQSGMCADVRRTTHSTL